MIDAHTHIGWDNYRIAKNSLPQRQSAKELIKKMDEAGIDKAVTFPFAFTSYFDLKTVYDRKMKPSKQMKYAYEDQNRYVVECARKYGRLVSFLTICLGEENNYEDIERLVKENQNVRGLKLHSRFSRSPIRELIGSRFMELAGEYKLSIMLHTDSKNISLPNLHFDCMDFSDPMQIIEVADKYPDVNIAGAHLGWLSYQFLEEVKKRENLFVDTSPFLLLCSFPWRADDALELDYDKPKEALYEICLEYGDSIIWGSDEPYTVYNSNTLHEEKQLLDSLNKKLKEKISIENTLRYLYDDL